MIKSVKQLLRYGICGLRSPLILLFQWKQVQKTIDGLCLGPGGEIVPWFTYACIEYLENLDLADTEIFEYGSGSSSLFWLRKNAARVIAVEHNPDWMQTMKKLAPARLMLKGQENADAYPDEIDSLGEFDIVLVDGIQRMACAKKAMNHLKTGGFIILDNAEWYCNTAAMLRQHGFTQIDFCGFTPLNSFTEMTSIFFRDRIKFEHLPKSWDWHPVGGKSLPAPPHDD